MKLLFDENLSPSPVGLLASEFPGSAHVGQLLGDGATDTSVWEFAKQNSYAIVSKDNDFRQRSFVSGPPPKVVWLSVGNDGTKVIAALLRSRVGDLLQFQDDPSTGLLVVSQ